jgi:predicted  nucleic acid-binding Zn-ribbon protein
VLAFWSEQPVGRPAGAQGKGSKVNAELENLIVLQAQDLELARLRGELAEAPRRVKAAEAAVAAAEWSLAACRQKLAAEAKLRRGQETEIGTHRTKLDRVRRSLDGATSAQQVSAFEHEIAFAQSAIGKLEDEEFASMERTDALETEEKSAVTALERARAALGREQEHAAQLTARNQATIAGVERERGNLREAIPPSRLAMYDKLAKARGTAVAEAIGSATAGKCAACQMGVRPQRWQDLTGRDHLDEIFTCESCGRMLFWDPRRDTPKPWAAGERLEAAQGAPGKSAVRSAQ